MKETNMEDALNTEESTRCGKRLRILINPKNLPQVLTASPIRLPDTGKMSMETRHAVRDYFWDKYTQGEKAARERKLI